MFVYRDVLFTRSDGASYAPQTRPLSRAARAEKASDSKTSTSDLGELEELANSIFLLQHLLEQTLAGVIGSIKHSEDENPIAEITSVAQESKDPSYLDTAAKMSVNT